MVSNYFDILKGKRLLYLHIHVLCSFTLSLFLKSCFIVTACLFNILSICSSCRMAFWMLQSLITLLAIPSNKLPNEYTLYIIFSMQLFIQYTLCWLCWNVYSLMIKGQPLMIGLSESIENCVHTMQVVSMQWCMYLLICKMCFTNCHLPYTLRNETVIWPTALRLWNF